MKSRCVVLGAGGHAKVVIEALRLEGKHWLAGVTDSRPEAGRALNTSVLGDDRILSSLRGGFVVGLGGVPDNRPRAALFMKGVAAGLRPLTVIHPSAVISREAVLGPGTVVLPRAVLNAGCIVGKNVIVNTAAVVEHDARIADHAHVAPGAILCGAVEVGEGAFIGAGAVVRQGIRIGAWAVVGAGSMVLKDVPAAGRVCGVPARPLKRKRP